MIKSRKGVAITLILAAFLAGILVSASLDIVGDLRASATNDKNPSQNIETANLLTSNPFVGIARKVSPSVVNINTTRIIKNSGRRSFRGFGRNNPLEDFFGEDFFERFFGEIPERELKQKSLGSGFIIDSEGYILTNNHVVEKADDIKVTLTNGKDYKAEIVGRDPSTDIALIKIKDNGNLAPVSLGDSENLEVGEWVMAIGNPFGLKHTVTVGVVSAKGRTIGAGPYDNFIQTDASINPGNSGGPLININGEVVGINTAIIASGQGIGFAIPINMAKDIFSQLKETGHVTRGWMGVQIQPITEELAETFSLKDTKGALVAGVVEGDPADKAGIKRGDVIVEFDGKKVESEKDLVAMVGSTPVDKEVDVKVIRGGKEKSITVKVARKAEKEMVETSEKVGEDKLGLTVQDITDELAGQLGAEPGEGVLISNVESGSPSDEGGLRRGDVILEINRQSIKSTGQFRKIVADIEKEQVVLFLVQRQGGTMFLTVKAR